MPTLKKIAFDLNLSVSTVSRILNGKAKKFRISEKTVQAVLKYADNIGYAPNLIAKGLQASQTYTLGLMVPDIANPFFSRMAKNIEKWASKENYSIILVDSDEDVEKEKQQLKNMIGRKVDALIVVPVGASYNHFKEKSVQNIPLIFMDRYFTESGIPFITSDNYQGAYNATKALTDCGHKEICLISGNSRSEIVQERNKGYKDALRNAGLTIQERLILGNDFSIENGRANARKILSSNNSPTAIFAMNNLIGFGVLKAINELNLTIPSISLIIFDDLPYLSMMNPPISAIKQNSEKIGEMAVKTVLRKINKEQNIASLKIPTQLILRESIKKPG